MILVDFAKQERRESVGQMNLPRALEVALRAVETLRHHAEIDVICAENVPHLPQHFLHANIGAGVARAVVAGKQQLQFLARRPALAQAEHPAEAPNLDQRADPRDQKKVGHARALPATAEFFAATLPGAVADGEFGHGAAG